MQSSPQARESILIIEDDKALRDTLAELLRDEGYRVETAAGGFEALYQLENKPVPKLILLDLMMGLMSGWEFRQRQQRNERIASIPTVIVSAAEDLPTHAANLGVNGYLKKPINMATLLNVVEKYVAD